MAYATYTDVQTRLNRTLSTEEQSLCTALLDDASLIIDAYNENAESQNKLVVACRMVIRALGDGSGCGTPVGASQGTMTALGYSQTWTLASGGSAGELYISKADKKILGASNRIGSYSPVEEL